MPESRSCAEALALAVERSRGVRLPAAAQVACEALVIDIAGLCVAARTEPYVRAALQSWDAEGPGTAIGHARTLDAAGAAFVNGTAAHGEDFDDTFEGGPVHAGAVIVPAVLAVAERHGIGGGEALHAIAVGCEVMCRASLVAPKRIHAAGFHPTAVLGVMGAATAVACALRLDQAVFVSAQGIAGSMAGGLIEYLAEGAWTKRMHPGWAAQSGIRAVELARAGFVGPRTVWEGTHGLLHGFARTTEGDWDRLLEGFGERWVMERIAFKPYACGTMIHPFVDCALRLAGRVNAEDVVEVECDTAEGIVHRLWEPLESKRHPPNGYAAKFSIPWCVGHALVHGALGLDAFDASRLEDSRVHAVSGKARYRIDPADPYPDEFRGHVRVKLRDGRTLEERQPHLRGGHREPLSRGDIERKFRENCRRGGWPDARADAWLALVRGFAAGPVELGAFRG